MESLLVRLESQTSSELSKTLTLPAKIGRRVGAKLVPSETNGIYESQVLSRNHAEIYYEDGKIFLKDLESSNGTFIEEERVEQPVELKDGMRIDFGVVVYDEEDEDSIKHDKVSVIVHFIQKESKQEWEDLPEVFVKSLPPNVNFKSEEVQELLLQNVLSILTEEFNKQQEIDANLREFTSLLESNDLQIKNAASANQVSGETIKLQREMRIIKKKNQDLELKSQQVTDFEEQNSKMKTEIDELKSSLIKAQKENRTLMIEAKKSKAAGDSSDKDAQIKEKDLQLKEKDEKLKAQEFQINELKKDKEQMQVTLVEKDALIKQLQEKLEEQGKEHDQLQEKLQNKKVEADKLTSRLELVQHQLIEAKVDLTESEANKQELMMLREENLDVKTKISSIEQELEKLRNDPDFYVPSPAAKRKPSSPNNSISNSSPSTPPPRISQRIRSIQMIFQKD